MMTTEQYNQLNANLSFIEFLLMGTLFVALWILGTVIGIYNRQRK